MMSETKFTKGEWKIFNERVGIVDESDSQSFGMMLEVAYIDKYNFGEQEGEANAHLIAAAPEMYALIEMILKCEHKMGGSLGVDGSFYYKVSEGVFKKADKILAKARGEK